MLTSDLMTDKFKFTFNEEFFTGINPKTVFTARKANDSYIVTWENENKLQERTYSLEEMEINLEMEYIYIADFCVPMSTSPDIYHFEYENMEYTAYKMTGKHGLYYYHVEDADGKHNEELSQRYTNLFL